MIFLTDGLQSRLLLSQFLFFVVGVFGKIFGFRLRLVFRIFVLALVGRDFVDAICKKNFNKILFLFLSKLLNCEMNQIVVIRLGNT